MKWYKKKKFIIPVVILLALVVVRILLQPVLLAQINKKLETFSPEITGHVDGLNLAIIRGAFGLDDISMRLKKTKKPFLKVKDVDVWSPRVRPGSR
jgi:autotransporter translocation and assembly factor TamB